MSEHELEEPIVRIDVVTPVRHRWVCSECHGELGNTGSTQESALDVWFEHKCDGCGRRAWASRRYPYITYETA